MLLKFRQAMVRWLGSDIEYRYRAFAEDHARLERQVLSLQDENSQLKTDLLSRPSQGEIQLLKTQVDQLSFQFTRRQVYGTLAIPTSTTEPPAERTSSPTQNPASSRARDFSTQIRSHLTDLISQDYQGRHSPLPAEQTAPSSPTEPVN